jgi:hypothetical protein
MTKPWIGFGAVLLSLAAVEALAETKATVIQGRLRGAISALDSAAASNAAATNAAAAAVGGARPAPVMPADTAAGKASNLMRPCATSLEADAELETRIEWAGDAINCLDQLEATFQTQRYLSDPESQSVAATVLIEVSTIKRLAAQYLANLEGERDFLGAKWGVGVGYSHAFRDVVDEAAIVDGLVRVKKDLTGQPRVVLEFHNYVWCRDGNRKGDVPIQTGCGLFAAVATRDDKVVSAVGAGFMYGWKVGTGSDAKGFSVGAGVIVDGSGKKLGKGYVDGEAPPAGATTVFLVDKAVVSWMVFFTRTF